MKPSEVHDHFYSGRGKGTDYDSDGDDKIRRARERGVIWEPPKVHKPKDES